MNLMDVIDEIRDALDTISGLRVPKQGAKSFTPPAAVVALPERINYDETYVRGTDRYPDLPVLVLVGQPDSAAAQNALADYANGSGAKSVKQAIESYEYTTCHPDTVRVAWCEFNEVSYNDIPYLAAIFHVELTGSGT